MAFKKREAQQKSIDKASYRVMIATPSYDGHLHMDYVISIAETCHTAPLFGIHATVTILKNGAFIDLARNRLVRMFLDDDYTHLFFIDGDLRWDAGLFVGMVKSGLPICAAVYPKRQKPEEYPARWAKDPIGGGVWVSSDGSMDHDKIADNGWIMCERVPTGFLCITRETIEQMVAGSPKQKMQNAPEQPLLFAATHFVRGQSNEFLPVDLINGKFQPNDPIDFIGEDFYFSDRYHLLTGKYIPAWPDADFTHGEHYTGNWHKFLIAEGEKNVALEAEGKINDVLAMKLADENGVRWFEPAKHMKDEYRTMSQDEFVMRVLLPLKEAA